ncbi:MAG: helix-turn-helix domain-containing protein [Lachnospiraceae bacterium]|nr:helix-turn-helix domain-containing protein [Lachnospiraceae bacterium]
MGKESNPSNIKVLTVKDVCEILHIGRDKAYALFKSEGFPSICLGGRYFVTEASFINWLHQYEYKEFAL